MYTKFLTVVKQSCEAKMAELHKPDTVFEPSALLVDNSDAEISAGKYALDLDSQCSFAL